MLPGFARTQFPARCASHHQTAGAASLHETIEREVVDDSHCNFSTPDDPFASFFFFFFFFFTSQSNH
jgi:hypothetical protein